MVLGWETLSAYGIPVARHLKAENLFQAQAFAALLGGIAVCLKADTNEHKAANGLVFVGATAGASLNSAWRKLEENSDLQGLGPPFLIQELVPPGPELFAGVINDPDFGQVIVAGLGGRLVEAIGRRTLRVLPITKEDSVAMVAELSLENLQLPKSLASFSDALFNLSKLVIDHPEIDELDLNPIILGEISITVVDLRIILQKSNPNKVKSIDALLGDARPSISRLISPKSVAVIGASSDTSKPGGRAFDYLLRLAPDVSLYPVNSKGGEINGVRVFKSISELPIGIDTAIIATPASSIPALIQELGKQEISTAVVFGSGFSETGNKPLELEVFDAARKNGVRVCGVNGMGLIGDVPLTFSQALLAESFSGGVSFLTQSGAIGGSLLIGAWSHGLGTARFISVGNETDLGLHDFLDFLIYDESTKVIGIFLEGLRDGDKFRAALKKCKSVGKKVVILRAGRSAVGAESVLSHTGALAGSEAVYNQVFKNEGVVTVSDIDELLGACEALEWQPQSAGIRVGVLSTSGGGCSLIADHLTDLGFEIPELSSESQEDLKLILPAFAPKKNPIDTTGTIAGDPSLLGRIILPVINSPKIDSVIIGISALVGEAATHIAKSIVEASIHSNKPIVVAWMLPESAVAEPFKILRENRIPVFPSIGAACKALAALTPQLNEGNN
jgi:acyl-CoA synthetase (NDP forming)